MPPKRLAKKAPQMMRVSAPKSAPDPEPESPEPEDPPRAGAGTQPSELKEEPLGRLVGVGEGLADRVKKRGRKTRKEILLPYPKSKKAATALKAAMKKALPKEKPAKAGSSRPEEVCKDCGARKLGTGPPGVPTPLCTCVEDPPMSPASPKRRTKKKKPVRLSAPGCVEPQTGDDANEVRLHCV